MCGIWLFVGDYKLYNPKIYELLESRGPDQQNIIKNKNFQIAFYRLAIQDLSSNGLQPFYYKNGDNTFALICNGEIYNFQELSKKYDIQLETKSDCEIILKLFLKLNKDINLLSNELDGEFAFIILEYNDDSLKGWVSRDPWGVRPLFYGMDENKIIFSSLLKGISGETKSAEQFPPGHFLYFENKEIKNIERYYNPKIKEINDDLNTIYKNICDKFIGAIQKRFISDRPIGALLSGGLDSSLIVAIIYKILKKKIKVFSIGLQGCESTDIKNAKIVVDHLDIKSGDFILIDPKDALSIIDKVIYECETYDITTIRASIMQYLCAEYIKNNSDIKVILNGDGADELQMGYIYIKLAKNEEDALKENYKLLNEIHFYDGLRVDRCLGSHGLEARIPYLDKDFVEYFLSIPLKYRLPFENIEKNLIRQAFATIYPNLLPESILFRKKEAFSDGVSSKENSWYKMLQDHIDEHKIKSKEYIINKPFSKESFYYRQKFNEFFNLNNNNYDNVIPHFWQPNFTDVKDPSARELNIY